MLFLPGEQLVCPSGHPLSGGVVTLPPGHVIRQCRFRSRRERDRLSGHACMHWLWIYTHENGSHTVVWIAESERDAIRDMRMRPADARTYLGLTWPALTPVTTPTGADDDDTFTHID